MAGRYEIVVSRIETLAVDAVVNAANRELLPGTGVDGALRVAAGPELSLFTSSLPPIDEGEAVLTPGFNAPARFIIHTAAPIWFLPGEEEAKIAGLMRCYDSSIALAHAHGLRIVAFPCLGTGNYGWPRDLACDIAIAACDRALDDAPSVAQIVFCCFTETDALPYRERLAFG